VRRALLIPLALTALLSLPAAAPAAKFHFAGSLVDDATATIEFDAVGRLSKKGRFTAKRVQAFAVKEIAYSCQDPGGQPVSTRRSDLPFSAIGPLALDGGGGFAGTASAGGGTFTITGGIHKGSKASGSILGSEGQPNVTRSCTTAEHRWTAVLIPHLCKGKQGGSKATRRIACVGP
jgi:hypothetical protein